MRAGGDPIIERRQDGAQTVFVPRGEAYTPPSNAQRLGEGHLETGQPADVYFIPAPASAPSSASGGFWSGVSRFVDSAADYFGLNQKPPVSVQPPEVSGPRPYTFEDDGHGGLRYVEASANPPASEAQKPSEPTRSHGKAPAPAPAASTGSSSSAGDQAHAIKVVAGKVDAKAVKTQLEAQPWWKFVTKKEEAVQTIVYGLQSQVRPDSTSVNFDPTAAGNFLVTTDHLSRDAFTAAETERPKEPAAETKKPAAPQRVARAARTTAGPRHSAPANFR